MGDGSTNDRRARSVTETPGLHNPVEEIKAPNPTLEGKEAATKHGLQTPQIPGTNSPRHNKTQSNMVASSTLNNTTMTSQADDVWNPPASCLLRDATSSARSTRSMMSTPNSLLIVPNSVVKADRLQTDDDDTPCHYEEPSGTAPQGNAMDRTTSAGTSGGPPARATVSEPLLGTTSRDDDSRNGFSSVTSTTSRSVSVMDHQRDGGISASSVQSSERDVTTVNSVITETEVDSSSDSDSDNDSDDDDGTSTQDGGGKSSRGSNIVVPPPPPISESSIKALTLIDDDGPGLLLHSPPPEDEGDVCYEEEGEGEGGESGSETIVESAKYAETPSSLETSKPKKKKVPTATLR